MMKKAVFFAAALLIMAGLFAGCSDSGSSGGAGADFDASLYYTKTEVDDLVTGVVTAVADPYSLEQSITGNNADGGTGTGWVVPAGVTGVLMELRVMSNGTNTSESLTTYIGIGSAYAALTIVTSMTVPSDSLYDSRLFYAPVTGGTTVKAWHPHEDDHVGISDLAGGGFGVGFDISIRPVVWFR